LPDPRRRVRECTESGVPWRRGLGVLGEAHVTLSIGAIWIGGRVEMKASGLRHRRPHNCGERRSAATAPVHAARETRSASNHTPTFGCPRRMMAFIMPGAPMSSSAAAGGQCQVAAQQVRSSARASANRNASHVDAPSPRCSYREPAQAQQRKWGWPAPRHKADRSHPARCCASQAASVPVS
jgi:hypothetical protein